MEAQDISLAPTEHLSEQISTKGTGECKIYDQGVLILIISSFIRRWWQVCLLRDYY